MVVLEELPEHSRIYSELETFFKSLSPVVGIFLSGSSAIDTMDQYSDIDLGVVFDTVENMDSFWKLRWDWKLPRWFHRFDADHVRDYFIIYLFEPNVKVDIVLYTLDSIPPPEGGPYLLRYAKESKLNSWEVTSNSQSKSKILSSSLELEEIIHDDERMWAWLYYCYLHIARGEYYTLAADFFMLRGIVEKWIAHFKYQSVFRTRRLEGVFRSKDLDELKHLFPTPEEESLIHACKLLIDLTIELRNEIGVKFGNIWRTSDSSIEKIRQEFCSLLRSES
ncbi:MAG: nucleotidyltransferase domain-containing protein [Candidatus Hodarchaeales archaeon]|jgi:predicted nucleotidyltransferase